MGFPLPFLFRFHSSLGMHTLAPAVLGCFLLVVEVGAAAGDCEIRFRGQSNSVPAFEPVEFSIRYRGNPTNPFDPAEADVRLKIVQPDGVTVSVPAFWMQDYERMRRAAPGGEREWFYPKGVPEWRGRFAPNRPGRYRVSAVVKDAHGISESSTVGFGCLPSTNNGFVRVSKKDPRFLEFDSGRPFFAIGQNLAFIGDQQYVGLSKAESIFSQLQTHGANYLRVWTCCEDWALAIEARKSAWGRSWDWRPPIVEMPGSPGRRCLSLTGAHPLRADASHAVGLRPGVAYRLTAKAKSQQPRSLRVEINSARRERFEVTPEGWSPLEMQFKTGPEECWLSGLTFSTEGPDSIWLANLSLREAQGGPELLWEAEANRPVRGFYNPLDCFILDELLRAAAEHGIYLQLCLLTRDLYMKALKQRGDPEYDQAIQDARKLFRYAVARWGYSTSVAAWEYWNEMDPGLPTDRFYDELGAFLEQEDVYHHLRTTSTWGPSAKDCRHPRLDFADTHFYLRPSDKGRLENEVEAVLDRTKWLLEQAPRKPAHLGEFGLADDKWGITEEARKSPELVDVHNALWASALSGASGTALLWWWERLDQRNVYPLYAPLGKFIADLPWNSGLVEPFQATDAGAKVRCVGLRAGRNAWGWLFNQESTWAKIVSEKTQPSRLEGVRLPVNGLPDGEFSLTWSDTRTGDVLRREKVSVRNGILELAAPGFSQDIAWRLRQD
jgi:hypothetical protein